MGHNQKIFWIVFRLIFLSIAVANTLGCTSPQPMSSAPPTIRPYISSTSPVKHTDTNKPSNNLTSTPPESLSTPPQIELYLNDVIWKMIEEVDFDRALIDLRRLTGEDNICNDENCFTIKNRGNGTEGLKQAQYYVYQELARLGYSVGLQDWSDSGHSGQNLIARKSGQIIPNEEIYFVAHLDSVKSVLRNQFPAADDNASGVVDLLEVARVLSNYSFSRTLVFFFSSGEELGTKGVQSYLNQLSLDDLNSIKYVVNVDMVGYDANHDWVMELWHGGDSRSIAFAELMNDTFEYYQLKLVPRFVIGCG